MTTHIYNQNKFQQQGPSVGQNLQVWKVGKKTLPFLVKLQCRPSKGVFDFLANIDVKTTITIWAEPITKVGLRIPNMATNGQGCKFTLITENKIEK